MPHPHPPRHASLHPSRRGPRRLAVVAAAVTALLPLTALAPSSAAPTPAGPSTGLDASSAGLGASSGGTSGGVAGALPGTAGGDATGILTPKSTVSGTDGKSYWVQNHLDQKKITTAAGRRHPQGVPAGLGR